MSWRARCRPDRRASTMHKNRPISANRLVIPFEKNDNGVGAIDVSDKNVGSPAPRPVTALGRSNRNVVLDAKADGNVASEARRLSTLLEVSQALSGTLNLKASLHRVLEILGKAPRRVRSIVTLLPEEGDSTSKRRTASTSPRRRPLPGRRRHHRPRGRERKPIVVPRVSREPAFSAPRVAAIRAGATRSSASSACRSC